MFASIIERQLAELSTVPDWRQPAGRAQLLYVRIPRWLRPSPAKPTIDLTMRILNGVFPVFKPTGITSSQFLEVIKNKMRTELVDSQHLKMGHGGTLDKAAQGVLVVGVGSGCSSLPAFLDGHKQYKTKCVLGTATNTFNNEGVITMEKSFGCSSLKIIHFFYILVYLDHLSHEDVQLSLNKFIGKIMQKPPPYSALKLGGKRLSDLCREGVDVDPTPRPVTCHWINITHFCLPFLTLKLSCGRGFYVRSLVHDLGIDVGCCAHVQELERTVQGPFSLTDCLSEEYITLDAVNEKIAAMKKKLDPYLNREMKIYRSKQKKSVVGFHTMHNSQRYVL